MLRASAAALLLAMCVVARGADHPLEAFPDSTGLVVHLKTPQTTLKKAAEFVGKVDESWRAPFDRGTERIGELIYNLKLEGIDVKGDWWVAVFPGPDGEPGVVFAVPVSDASAAKKATGDSFQYASYQNWLLYSDHDASFDAVEKRVKGEGKSIVPVIDRESRRLLDDGDVGVFVNVKQLLVTYKNELDNFKTQAEQGLKQLGQAHPGAPGMNVGAMFSLYGELLKSVLKGLEDSEGFTFAATLGDKGLMLEELFRVKAESEADKFFQSQPPSALTTLDKLPGGQRIYYGLHGDGKSLTQWGMKMSGVMFEGNSEAKKAMEAAAAELAKLKIGGYVGSIAVGDLKDGLFRMTAVSEVDQPEKMRDLYRVMPETFAKLEGLPFKQELKIEKDAEKYGDRSGDIVTIKQEADPKLDPLGMQKQILNLAYGPQGMVTRVVVLKEMLVQTVGGGKPAMEELLKALDGSAVSTADPRAAARQQLSKEANLVFLIDLPGLAVDALGTASQFGQLPIPIDAAGLKGLGIEPSYLGCSVTTEKQGVRAKTHVPLEQLQGIAKLIKQFVRQAGAPPQ